VNAFVINVLLALTWAVATRQFTPGNLAVGYMLGFLILWYARRALAPTHYFTKLPQVARFAVFYIGQLILSNLRVAYDVVTPQHYMRPGVIAVPLEARTDAEITLLANLITLTPGTLSLDLSEDRKYLYVHVMYIDQGDIDAARRNILEGLERRVLEVLR
jgi:multicomponent Na+:H+ antiporter subunit E